MPAHRQPFFPTDNKVTEHDLATLGAKAQEGDCEIALVRSPDTGSLCVQVRLPTKTGHIRLGRDGVETLRNGLTLALAALDEAVRAGEGC